MTKLAAVAANFTRDLEQNYALIDSLAREARDAGVDFMVLPEAAIGGYLSSLGNHGDTVKTTNRSLPPAIRVDGPPEIARVQQIVGDLVVAIGFCELDADGETRYNAAAVLDGSRVYGTYRKVHQPSVRACRTRRAPTTTCSTRRSAGWGCRSATTRPSPPKPLASWRSRAPDHRQPVGVAGGSNGDRGEPAGRPVDVSVQPVRRGPSAGQPGVLDRLQPEWHVRLTAVRGQREGSRPWWKRARHNASRSGMAVADVDVDGTFRAMRAGMFHLRDRRPDVYGPVAAADGVDQWQELAHA